jgi:hypothetical protein
MLTITLLLVQQNIGAGIPNLFTDEADEEGGTGRVWVWVWVWVAAVRPITAWLIILSKMVPGNVKYSARDTKKK